MDHKKIINAFFLCFFILFLNACSELSKNKEEIELKVEKVGEKLENFSEAKSKDQFDFVWKNREKAAIQAMEASVLAEAKIRRVNDSVIPEYDVTGNTVWKEILYNILTHEPIIRNFGCVGYCYLILFNDSELGGFRFIVKVPTSEGSEYYDLKTRRQELNLGTNFSNPIYYPVVSYPYTMNAMEICSDENPDFCYLFYPTDIFNGIKGFPSVNEFTPEKDKCLILENPFSEWRKCKK